MDNIENEVSLNMLKASSLTIAISDIQLVSNRLESTTTPPLAIVNAFPVINVSLNALTAEVRAINIIVVHQVVAAFTPLQKRVHILAELIDI
jgi:hypothetical protein